MPASALSRAARKLFDGATAISPVRDLFLVVTAYKLAEILFFGFTLAYAFSTGGFHLAILSALAVSILVSAGYWAGLACMANSAWRTRHLLRIASITTCLCVAGAGLADGRPLSLALLVAGAFPAGAAYGAKQWHEMTRTNWALRESYLSFGQSAWAVVRVAGLAGCASLLTTVGSDFKIFFFVSGVIAATVIAAAGPLKRVTVVPHAPRPFGALRSQGFWRASSFFMLETGATWLRDLVAICGAMTLVSSAAVYGWLETASSLMAAGAMAWLAGRQIDRPSIARLQLGLAGAIAAWLAFAGSLAWPPLFAAFVVLRAFATPVMAATYDSLVMHSVEEADGSLQSAAVAREISLMLGRCLALGLAAAFTASVSDPRAALLTALALTLLALPVEYVMSRRLAIGRPSTPDAAGRGHVAIRLPVTTAPDAAARDASVQAARHTPDRRGTELAEVLRED